MRSTFRFVLVCCTLAALLAGSAAAAGYGHVRDGWLYGLNLGYGWAKASARDVDNAVDLESEWSGDFTGGLRIAFCRNEQIAIGIDVSGWADDAGGLDEDVFAFLAQVHWFPQGQGFFVRGGAGFGSLGLTYRGPAAVISETNSGFAWGAGAGFEVRVTPSFALGIAYDYRSVDVGEVATLLEDVSTQVQGVTLNLAWYPE